MRITDGSDGTREGRRRYDRLAQRLRAGHRHPTLGLHPDRGDADWWQAGEARFAKMIKKFGIAPQDRVIDYGCGTLRLGGHFMRYLDRGHYFGLEVAGDLIEMGRELVGTGIIADRAPYLAVIDEQSLSEGEAFQASFLFSEAVSYHVVPDELDFYYGALRRLAAAPGSALFFNVWLADVESEHIHGCWARPLQHYVKALAPLAYAKMHFVQVGVAGSKHAGITSATLEFRRS